MLLFGQGLFNLCLIMGISSWVGLCRILRGETLRLRELEYVQAAEAFGVRRGFIILKHPRSEPHTYSVNLFYLGV